MIRDLLELLEMLSVLVCIHALYGKKIIINKYHIFYVVFSMAVVSAVNEGILSERIIMFSYVGMYIFCVFAFQSRYIEALVNCVLTIILLGILQMIFYFPAFYLAREGESSVLLRLFIHVFCILSVVVIDKIVKLHLLSQYFLKRNILLTQTSHIDLTYAP